MDDLTAIPATLTAGDSYGLVLSLSDYPATSGWSLDFAIAGPSVKAWTSAADGDAHRFTVSTADTTALTSGTYQWRVRATDGTNARVVQSGTLVVEADLGEAAPGQATAWEETTLAVLKAALAGTLQGEMQMYMIAGRQVMTFKPTELLELHDVFQARVDRLKAQGARGTLQFTSKTPPRVLAVGGQWC